MNFFNEQLRQELLGRPGVPFPIVDEHTNQVYYLLSAEQFERVKALLADEPCSPSETYPLIAKTAGDAGWNDPVMNDYDRYDELRSES